MFAHSSAQDGLLPSCHLLWGGTLPDHLQSIHAAIDTLRARAEALPELGSAALGGFLEPPPLQPLDHTSISQMRKDLEAAHQKQLHAKGDHSP